MIDPAFVDRHFQTQDGLTLHARDYGLGDGVVPEPLPVICLPGLTRNARDFHQMALALSRDVAKPRRVIAIDSRGRGGSERDNDPTHYNLLVEANDVVNFCADLGISQAIFIGTSRGGLLMHILMAIAPTLISAGVLNDVGPELGVEGLLEIQSYLSSGRQPSDWDAAAAMLKAIHQSRFPAFDDGDWKDMADAIFIEDATGIHSDYDPAIAAQMASLDLSQPLPDLWAQFDLMAAIPLMVVRGETSLLLTEGTLAAMQERHQGLAVCVAAGQGHAPNLHAPQVLSAIQKFLASL
jgi:pimeloyl-ACP methyl ester carboxylesterase